MTRFTFITVALAAPIVGCSVIVDDMIAQLPGPSSDGGPDTRDGCRTTQDCFLAEGAMFNCHVQCVMDAAGEGRCDRNEEINTPDGVYCGVVADENQICIGGRCVDRACGDGFVDRRGPMPEYCDPGDPSMTCDADCTRRCEAPAPRTCPEGDGNECMGGAGVCNTDRDPDACFPSAVVPDGTPCMLTGERMGTCEAGACIEELTAGS